MKIFLIIKNIIIITLILGFIFLSQQPYFKSYGQKFYLESSKQINYYWLKVEDWITSNIYPKVESEIEKRGEEAKEEITKQKDNFLKIIWENLKNTLAEKFSKTFGTKVE